MTDKPNIAKEVAKGTVAAALIIALIADGHEIDYDEEEGEFSVL